MSVSTSRRAYDDCYAILDQALESKNGLRYYETSEGKANHLCSRLNYARVLARRLTMETFEEGDPKHGVTEYDSLIIRRPLYVDGVEGKWWIYIEKTEKIIMDRVEEI